MAEAKGGREKNRTEERRKEKEKTKKEKNNGGKKITEKWKIWDEEKEVVKLEKNWFLQGSTNRSISLERKQVREC